LSDEDRQRVVASKEEAARESRGWDVQDVLGKPGLVVGIEADVGGREDWFEWWPRPVS
jgi:alpha 1,6-mannosyltransferase